MLILPYLVMVINSCQKDPAQCDGPQLTETRDQHTVEQLPGETDFAPIYISYFARPEWGKPAIHNVPGSISFEDTEMIFPLEREYYPGENIFPGITQDFVSHGGELIPVRNEIPVGGLAGNI
jgi:hypothetical protein